MATKTATRPQEKTGNWSAIFPNEQVTEQQSALFVKKLLAVAISNITYLRAIFPEHAFGDRCLEDLNLKILRDDTSCPGACQVIKWVKGCFDALDKKYLRMLIIGIYVDPDDPDTVIESYTFKFSYTQNGGIDIYRNSQKISSAYTAAETKKATIRLLRTIVVLTQTLKSLPDDVMMTMKLLYFDDVTPLNYEPPGFRSSECDSFVFEEQPMNIKVGDVATPFHSIKMRIKTDSKQFELKDENEEKAEESTDEEEEEETESKHMDVVIEEQTCEVEVSEESGKDNVPFQVPKQCEVVPTESPVKPGGKAVKEKLPLEVVMEAEEEFGVKCPCGCNEDDGLMILCSVCKFWQHGVCFMILKEDEAPEKHVCSDCASLDNVGDGDVTDPYLIGLSAIAVQATCLWRKALIACTETSRVMAPTFSRRLGVEMTVAQGLINRLEKEGYIKSSSKAKRLGKVVNKEKILCEGVQKYFKKSKIPSESNKENRNPVNKMSEEPATITSDPHFEPTVSETASNEIQSLAERTKCINLDGNKKKEAKCKKRVKMNPAELRKSPRFSQHEPYEKKITPKPEDSERKGRKRAISKVDQATEFDVSNSQDVDYDSVYTRKRKASIAARAIMV